MEKNIKPIRIGLLIFFVMAVISIYIITLYDLQVIQGATYLDQSLNNTEQTSTVAASRGSILDRNGTVLVSDRACYNITIDRGGLTSSDNPGDVILRLVETARELDCEYTDSLPITSDATFEFTEMTDTQQTRLDAYIEYYGDELSAGASAAELMAHMRSNYGVDPSYTAAEARTIVGVRFEVELRYIIGSLSAYVFAEDVGTDFLAIIGEQDFPGVRIVDSTVREYRTAYAAHILGRAGLMTAEEYDVYKDEGYAMDAIVGKSGIEKIYESYLHGTNGKKVVTSDSSGSTIAVVDQEETEPGEDVVLTIDIGLQAAAETSLSAVMTKINSQRNSGEDRADAGAAVVLDIKSGEVLASASNPSFNLETYLEDYEALAEDKTSPLTNRATMGLYQPGSTFKMVTAMAALDTGRISANTTYTCNHSYKLGDRTFLCLGNHGTVNLGTAIAKSCNIYFYNLAEDLGVSTLVEYAEAFGLGSPTGLELTEAEGIIASPEYEEYLYEQTGDEYYTSWYTGQTLQAAIGQSYHQFTPMQMANYIATIANNGVRYSTTLLSEIQDSVTHETVYSEGPEILYTLDTDSGNFAAIQAGMLAVTQSGTSSSLFSDLNVSVAAKTGTAQTNNDTDDGIFVCYAPANDPQIAIAVVIEKGESGTNAGLVAKDILEYYFRSDSSSTGVSAENTLLR